MKCNQNITSTTECINKTNNFDVNNNLQFSCNKNNNLYNNYSNKANNSCKLYNNNIHNDINSNNYSKCIKNSTNISLTNNNNNFNISNNQTTNNYNSLNNEILNHPYYSFKEEKELTNSNENNNNIFNEVCPLGKYLIPLFIIISILVFIIFFILNFEESILDKKQDNDYLKYFNPHDSNEEFINKKSKIIESENNNSTIVPPADYHKYKSITLKNGLEVLLISNPITKFSSASLSVAVGSQYDPPFLPGLAHFCEHMLFLGSNKYPSSLEYFQTVTQNSGHFNAYTDRNITNFFFDVHTSSFNKVLSRFSRFFIDPLLSKEYLEKEVNSVNSEFEKNLILDKRKISQIFNSLTNKEIDFNKFSTGNKETLFYFNHSNINYEIFDEDINNQNEYYEENKSSSFSYFDKYYFNLTNLPQKYTLKKENNNIKSNNYNIDLYKFIHDFHKKFYTSDRMKLVVYTGIEVEEIEKMILYKFNEIKPSLNFLFKFNSNKHSSSNKLKNINKENLIHSNKNQISDLVLNNDVKGSIVLYNPIVHDNEMNIKFVIPNTEYLKTYLNSPVYYFTYLIENKSKGSLIDNLKTLKLSNSLSVYLDSSQMFWTILCIKINLTKEGLKNIKQVLYIVNEYLLYINKYSIKKDIYNELKKSSEISFNTVQTHKLSLSTITSALSAKLHKKNKEYLLDFSHFIKEFDYNVLKDFGKALNMKYSIVFLPYQKEDSENIIYTKHIVNINDLYNTTNNYKSNNHNNYNHYHKKQITVNAPIDDLIKYMNMRNKEVEFKYSSYENWYQTAFSLFKVNYDKIKEFYVKKSATESNSKTAVNYKYFNSFKNAYLKNKKIIINKFVNELSNISNIKYNNTLLNLNNNKQLKATNKLNIIKHSLYTFLLPDLTNLKHYNNKLHYLTKFSCNNKYNIEDNSNYNTIPNCLKDFNKFEELDPILLNNTSNYELWHKQFNTLDFNKVEATLMFVNFPKVSTNPSINYLVKLDFIANLIKKKLKDLSYDLNLIQNSIKVYTNKRGLRVVLFVHSVLLEETLEKLCDSIKSNIAKRSLNSFDQIKEELRIKYSKESKSQPYTIAYQLVGKSLTESNFLSEDYVNEINKLQESDIVDFANNFLTETKKLKVLFTGDISQENSKNYFNNIVLKYFKITFNKSVTLKQIYNKNFILDNKNNIAENNSKNSINSNINYLTITKDIKSKNVNTSNNKFNQVINKDKNEIKKSLNLKPNTSLNNNQFPNLIVEHNNKLAKHQISGNGYYIIYKQYISKTANNAVVKCLYSGKNIPSNLYKLNLINSIIGNIVFQEIRVKLQMGYIAKNKIEIYDNNLYFCLHVQGSNNTPYNMDSAIENILYMIKQKLKNYSNNNFYLSKNVNYDIFIQKRLTLSEETNGLIHPIESNNYNFDHYDEYKNLRDNLTKDDLVDFWSKISGLSTKDYTNLNKEYEKSNAIINYLNNISNSINNKNNDNNKEHEKNKYMKNSKEKVLNNGIRVDNTTGDIHRQQKSYPLKVTAYVSIIDIII